MNYHFNFRELVRIVDKYRSGGDLDIVERARLIQLLDYGLDCIINDLMKDR